MSNSIRPLPIIPITAGSSARVCANPLQHFAPLGYVMRGRASWLVGGARWNWARPWIFKHPHTVR